MSAGLPAVLGLAAGAFAGTNVDNAAVTVAMIAAAPAERAKRIALGQVIGFVVLVVGAIGMAVLLFEIPTRIIGLFGLVPLTLGLRGLFRAPSRRGALPRRPPGHRERRLGRHHDHHRGRRGQPCRLHPALPGGRLRRDRRRHCSSSPWARSFSRSSCCEPDAIPTCRRAVTAIGVFAAPVLYCAIGILVLVEAGTLSFLR